VAESPASAEAFTQIAARIVHGVFMGETTQYEVELAAGVRWKLLRHDAAGGFSDGQSVRLSIAAHAWSAVAN
jgi:hypothetical protein